MAYPIGPGAGPGVGGGIPGVPGGEELGMLARGKQWAGTTAGKGTIGGILGFLLLDKYLSARHTAKMGDIQIEGIQKQAEAATPENLMAQMALPAAQEEERMARNALLLQLSGGVIGPQVARGNKMIGG